MKKLKLFLVIFFSFFTISVLADSSALAMLQSTSQQMLTALKNTPNRTTPQLYAIVKRVLLPHVDLDTMSRLVVDQPGSAGKYWENATPQQREQFKTLFTHYVTRMYSTALASYKGEQIIFSPRVKSIGANQVEVDSQIMQANGNPIKVSYQLLQTKKGWMVYDFSVDGVSMVQNYRSQFRDILMQQGFQGLLQKLQARIGNA